MPHNIDNKPLARFIIDAMGIRLTPKNLVKAPNLLESLGIQATKLEKTPSSDTFTKIK